MKPDIEKRLTYLKIKYKTMFETSQKTMLRLSAMWGRYTTMSKSTNIYMKDATNNQLKAIHSFTNKLRLKTGMYYLRQDPAASTGTFTLKSHIYEYIHKLNERLKKQIAVTSGTGSCELIRGCVSCN